MARSRSAYLSLLVAIAFSTGACITIPAGLEPVLKAQGAHATHSAFIGPMVVVSTASVIPGRAAHRPRFPNRLSCSDSSSRVRIELRSGAKIGPGDGGCGTLLLAVKWVLASAELQQAFRYEVSLVPTGTRLVERRTRLHSSKRVALAYTFAWDATAAEQSVADMADTLAHETMHLARSLRRVAGDVPSEEALAYRAGRCAQFASVGRLRLADMQTDVLAAEGPYKNVGISMAAGYASAQEFAKYIDATGVVIRHSEAGRALQADCDRFMATAFRKDAADTLGRHARP